MTDDLDALMQTNLLHPPADFTQRVMQQVQQVHRVEATQLHGPAATVLTVTTVATQPSRWHNMGWHNTGQTVRQIAVALGLVGSALVGISQLVGFVFGLWLASAAL